MKKIISLGLLLWSLCQTTTQAQQWINPVANFNLDADGDSTVIMTIQSPLGESNVDIGSFIQMNTDEFYTALGQVNRFIFVSEGRDGSGVPYWWCYAIQTDWDNQFTYEMHLYGAVLFCGSNYYNIFTFSKPEAYLEMLKWCRF